MSDRISELRRMIKVLRVELSSLEDGTLGAMSRSWITAKKLGERLGISEQAANNRLAKLVDAGLATRERRPIPGGGLRYAYRTVRGRR